MKLFLDKNKYISTENPIDISLPLRNTDLNPRAWYVGIPEFTPVRTEHYIGSVEEGGNVNFRDIFFNPHGHGTHTECLGHITAEVHSINKVLRDYFFSAQLITIIPKVSINESDGLEDRIITLEQLKSLELDSEALIIRTKPNHDSKRNMNYSNTNPVYLDVEIAQYLISRGIKHLLVDVPSVDRESDGGKLVFHHAYWQVPEQPNFERTITELIYVDDEILDGNYILELQVASFENDASPSRPVLYQIKKS